MRGYQGSLHKFDSFIPLIVTGDGENRPIPSRHVDFKGFYPHFVRLVMTFKKASH
jgi:hypothetical protein